VFVIIYQKGSMLNRRDVTDCISDFSLGYWNWNSGQKLEICRLIIL